MLHQGCQGGAPVNCPPSSRIEYTGNAGRQDLPRDRTLVELGALVLQRTTGLEQAFNELLARVRGTPLGKADEYAPSGAPLPDLIAANATLDRAEALLREFSALLG